MEERMGGKKILSVMIMCVAAALLAACDSAASPGATPVATLPAEPSTPTAIATEIVAETPTAPVAATTPTTLTTPTKSTTTGRPTAPVAGWDSKVGYEKSGGIAGIKKTLLVGPAGQARFIDGDHQLRSR